MAIIVRAFEAADLDTAAQVLNPWFASYLDHLDYSPAMLRFLDETLGWTRGPSVIAVEDGRPVGLILTGLREATFNESALRVINLGILAVAQSARRKGVARQMDLAVAERGRSMGAELIALLTQEIYGEHQVYQRLGYRPLQRFQPFGAAIGGVVRVPEVREVDAATFAAARPARLAGAGEIVEVGVAPAPGGHEVAPVRYWLGPRAGVGLVLWPVRVRVDGQWTDVISAQLTEVWGEGYDLMATTSTALTWAEERGAQGVMAMPATGVIPPGLITEGGSWTLRYARGITARGEQVVAQAGAYVEVCPAP